MKEEVAVIDSTKPSNNLSFLELGGEGEGGHPQSLLLVVEIHITGALQCIQHLRAPPRVSTLFFIFELSVYLSVPLFFCLSVGSSVCSFVGPTVDLSVGSSVVFSFRLLGGGG